MKMTPVPGVGILGLRLPLKRENACIFVSWMMFDGR
jgi:hypothetical protein